MKEFKTSHQLLVLPSCSYLFTTDPRGKVKLWRLGFAFADGNFMDCKASLLAEFTSSFGMRIMCLNALFEEEVTPTIFFAPFIILIFVFILLNWL